MIARKKNEKLMTSISYLECCCCCKHFYKTNRVCEKFEEPIKDGDLSTCNRFVWGKKNKVLN